MIVTAWIFVGVVAVLATGMALLTQDNGLAIMMGVLGFVSWGVWTFGSLNLQVVESTTIYQFSQPSVTMLGLALALVPGYIALTGPVEIVQRARRTRQEEV